MFEIKVTVDPAFTAAVNALANSFTGKLIAASNSAVAVAPTAPTIPVTQTAPATVPVAQTAPATVPMAAPAAAPTVPVAAPAPVAAPTVPTSAPAYTQEQISRAGTTLIDMGKMNDLMALLARYGVAAITQLKPETYGAVAAELRALGAQI